MPTDADLSTYPNNSKDGVAVPFSIGDPLGTFSCAFLSASASDTMDLGDTADSHIAVIKATQDCVIRFGTDDPVLTDEEFTEDQVYVFKGFLATVVIRDQEFKVRGLSANGQLYVQVFRRWEALSKATMNRNM